MGWDWCTHPKQMKQGTQVGFEKKKIKKNFFLFHHIPYKKSEISYFIYLFMIISCFNLDPDDEVNICNVPTNANTWG